MPLKVDALEVKVIFNIKILRQMGAYFFGKNIFMSSPFQILKAYKELDPQTHGA